MKYIDPDTYKQARIDAIRSMIYGQGLNLSEFERQHGVCQSSIQRILSPYHNNGAETVDRVYKLVYSFAPKPIDVIGPDYQEWYDALLSVIVDYQNEMGCSDREFCKIVNMNSSVYYKYKSGQSKPRDETLWYSFCVVRDRVRQLQ